MRRTFLGRQTLVLGAKTPHFNILTDFFGSSQLK